MTTDKNYLCSDCGGELKHYDSVKRTVLTKGRKAYCIRLKRYYCVKCGRVHRVIPRKILPYKHYEAEVVNGVLEGFITPDTLGFEDFPCETTMLRWIRQFRN